ncbi:MAG TPA: hypothetical protein VEQ37_05490 [Actinomycetota bacterium]|nr:hypothetical protein [Actinomycetota bacterium]
MSAVTASADSLPKLDGYPFEARYSESARAEAVRLADMAGDAYAYFAGAFLGWAPQFTAFLLAPDDWKVHVSSQGYGNPRYQPAGVTHDEAVGPASENRLIVATDDNAFWRSFGRIARVASPLAAWPRLKKTYTDPEGRLRMRGFFDLLVVHELVHAFEQQGGAALPALWLSEFFANLSLHAFIASERPSDLPQLTTFPEVMSRVAAFNLMVRLRGYRSLEDFEHHYPVGTEKPMNGPNYGWYQLRLHVLAREVFDQGGEEALARLYAFARSEDPRRASPWHHFLKHGTLTDWPGGMRRLELADLLAKEVSPRLGRAIADWH